VPGIYLDFNATTPVRRAVAEAIRACVEGDPGNPSSLHRFGRQAAALREDARERLAKACACPLESVVFTSGGTEADNLALRGVLLSRPGAHVVTAATEHEAVLQTVEALEEDGHPATFLRVDRDGRVDPDELSASLRRDTALVSLMAANNETGVLSDLEELGGLCRSRGVLFHTDAVQCFGKHRFSFADLPVDLASVSSHKLGGPKGVGALLVRRGVELAPLTTGGSQERRLRPGTENLPGIVGFGVAAEIASEELAAEGARLERLRDRLESGVQEALPGVVVNGLGASRLPNTASITFGGLDGESFLIALDLEGIAVSTGAACNAGAAKPSHVLLAMGRSEAEASATIRFSLGFTTTSSEIEAVVRIVPRVATSLASAGTVQEGRVRP
jgi:cysteine desulfurase